MVASILGTLLEELNYCIIVETVGQTDKLHDPDGLIRFFATQVHNMHITLYQRCTGQLEWVLLSKAPQGLRRSRKFVARS
jgi:hypothetical protein